MTPPPRTRPPRERRARYYARPQDTMPSEPQQAAILERAKENTQKAIQKLKASGKDYERSDIIKIYLRYYPTWSGQYQRKQEELPKKLKDEARSVAYKASQAALKNKVFVKKGSTGDCQINRKIPRVRHIKDR